MMSRYLLLICAPILIIKIITVECIPTPEFMAPLLLSDGIPDGMTVGSNIVINNIPIGRNIANIGPNMPENLPLNNIRIGSNMANNLGLGSNSSGAPGSGRFGFPSSSPAAMAPSIGIVASNGGGFTVTSSSPIALTGLTDNSENAIDGFSMATGELPFLGSVSLVGTFPADSGSFPYGSGDENKGMGNEGLSPSPVVTLVTRSK